jgi:hypothetical protein
MLPSEKIEHFPSQIMTAGPSIYIDLQGFSPMVQICLATACCQAKKGKKNFHLKL